MILGNVCSIATRRAAFLCDAMTLAVQTLRKQTRKTTGEQGMLAARGMYRHGVYSSAFLALLSACSFTYRFEAFCGSSTRVGGAGIIGKNVAWGL